MTKKEIYSFLAPFRKNYANQNQVHVAVGLRTGTILVGYFDFEANRESDQACLISNAELLQAQEVKGRSEDLGTLLRERVLQHALDLPGNLAVSDSDVVWVYPMYQLRAIPETTYELVEYSSPYTKEETSAFERFLAFRRSPIYQAIISEMSKEPPAPPEGEEKQ